MKKNIILLILIILIKYSFANEIKVQVNILPQILLGIEYDVNVDIINAEDKSIYLISNIEKGGFWISYVLYEESSGKVVECHTEQAQYLPGYRYIEIKPRGTYRRYLFSIQQCDIKVGQYKLEILYWFNGNWTNGILKIREYFDGLSLLFSRHVL